MGCTFIPSTTPLARTLYVSVHASGVELPPQAPASAQFPVATVKGLKVRTTDSPLEIALIWAWEGNPTPLAWTETVQCSG